MYACLNVYWTAQARSLYGCLAVSWASAYEFSLLYCWLSSYWRLFELQPFLPLLLSSTVLSWVNSFLTVKSNSRCLWNWKVPAIGQDVCCLFSGGISNAYLPSAPSSIHCQLCCTYSCSPHCAEYTFVSIFYTELYAYHTFREFCVSCNIYHLPHLPFTVNFVVCAAPLWIMQNILCIYFLSWTLCVPYIQGN